MDGVIPLVVACFEVGALQSEFLQQVVDAASHDEPLSEVPGDPAEVIESARVVMGCCAMAEQFNRALPAYRGRVVRFRLEREFWLSNFRTTRPHSFQVDPGDGFGERTLAFGEELTCVYPAGGGLRDVSIRFEMGGKWLSACARFQQVDEAAPPLSSETWSLLQGLTPVGQAWLHPSTAPNASRSLIILVEGFPGGYSRGYLYEMFNQHGLVDTWRARGYDVALLGFTDGLDRIETNAEAVKSAIKKAVTLTDSANPSADVSYQDIVVGSQYGWARRPIRAYGTRGPLAATSHAGVFYRRYPASGGVHIIGYSVVCPPVCRLNAGDDSVQGIAGLSSQPAVCQILAARWRGG